MIHSSVYRAPPASVAQIRALATSFRKALSLDNCLHVPIVEIAELAMPYFLGDKYLFTVLSKSEMGTNHGLTVFEEGQTEVRIRDDVYEGACSGFGRDRGTIAHELGHVILPRPIALSRNFGNSNVLPFEDPEWQAKCFQGELLVPYHLVSGMSDETVATECGVSIGCAKLQMKRYRSGK